MKIAVTGKGGVGKSTIAAILAQMATRCGGKVLVLDCDPDANLAGALGLTAEEWRKITPISKQKALIEERTGAKVKTYGQMFKLNPEVSDIAEKYAINHNGVDLLVLGATEEGGGGCACPENVLIKALVQDLILYKDDTLIMDMEAGVEHLGRATAKGVDTMLIVVEPGQNSIDCARRVIKMAGEIGIKDLRFIANKVNDGEDEKFLTQALSEHEFLAVIPFSAQIKKSDRDGEAAIDNMPPEILEIFSETLKKLSGES